MRKACRLLTETYVVLVFRWTSIKMRLRNTEAVATRRRSIATQQWNRVFNTAITGPPSVMASCMCPHAEQRSLIITVDVILSDGDCRSYDCYCYLAWRSSSCHHWCPCPVYILDITLHTIVPRSARAVLRQFSFKQKTHEHWRSFFFMAMLTCGPRFGVDKSRSESHLADVNN